MAIGYALHNWYIRPRYTNLHIGDHSESYLFFVAIIQNVKYRIMKIFLKKINLKKIYRVYKNTQEGVYM